MTGGCTIKIKGFTLVELLIVITVIGFLALIGIVTYRDFRARAELQVARTDMRNLGQAADIFRIENQRFPTAASDFSAILKNAKVYDSTRTPDKSYAICVSDEGYAFVAWNPVVEGVFKDDILYMYSVDGGQAIHTLTNSSLNSSNTIDKVCDQVYDDSTLDLWTYDIP